jgi:hypothetical protein
MTEDEGVVAASGFDAGCEAGSGTGLADRRMMTADKPRTNRLTAKINQRVFTEYPITTNSTRFLGDSHIV